MDEAKSGIASNGGDEHAPEGLYDNIPNLEKMRESLFEVQSPIQLSQSEFKQYWPYVDNVWLKQRSNASRDGSMVIDYYTCRLKRQPATRLKQEPARNTEADAEVKGEASGKKRRKRKGREGGICGMQIKIQRVEWPDVTYTVSRVSPPEEGHTHDLGFLDKIKRNSAIMSVARREASKGYHPSSVFAVLRKEEDTLTAAGGRYLSVSDIRNTGQQWRWDNPDVELKIHDGYEMIKGIGIRRIGEATADSGVTLSGRTSAVPRLPSNMLQFPEYARHFLRPYLPNTDNASRQFPHVTLTYASSLDSMLSLAPGTQTVLSGPESKAMTHYLRSQHDAILIGVGTVLADDPGLNCRLEGVGGFGGVGLEGQPRPIIIDPMAKWSITLETQMLRTVKEGRGKPPWIMVSPAANVNDNTLTTVKKYGGNYIRVSDVDQSSRIRWAAILRTLASEGIKSVMIEGGGTVMSDLLNPRYGQFVDSIIVTIAPTYLGRGGVWVCPEQNRNEFGALEAPARLREVRWQPMGDDVVMCAKPQRPS